MISINTNTNAAVSQNVLRESSRATEKVMQRLSSGVRVNSAADNTANFAMASRMEAFSRAQNRGLQNLNEGLSMLQTFTTTGKVIQDIVIKIRDLTLQANTDTLAQNDRAALNAEAFQLLSEWSNLANNTRWNGKAMMAQSWGGGPANTFIIGADSQGNNASVTLRDWRPATNEANAAADSSINGFATPAANPFYNLALVKADENGTANMIAGDNILHAADRTRMLAKTNLTLQGISDELSRYAIYAEKFEYVAKTFAEDAQLSDMSRSKIRDLNYAEEVSSYSRAQIITQAATAMIAQANSSSQTVMALLS